MNKEQQIERLEKDVNKAIVKNWKASEVAKCLYEAGYRKQEDTVKEFAEKLLYPLIKAYNQSYKASGYDTEAARSASEIKHYIDHIKQTAEQFGKEEI